MQDRTVGWPQKGYHVELEPFDTERFEYEVTVGPRKCGAPPPMSEGWVQLDWCREDFTDEALWRRERANG